MLCVVGQACSVSARSCQGGWMCCHRCGATVSEACRAAPEKAALSVPCVRGWLRVRGHSLLPLGSGVKEGTWGWRGGKRGSISWLGGTPLSTSPASSPGWARSCQTWGAWLGPRSCRSSSACRCVGICQVGWLDVAPPVPPGSMGEQGRIRNLDPALHLTGTAHTSGRSASGLSFGGPCFPSLMAA